MPLDHRVDGFSWRFNNHGQAQRCVQPVLAIIQGLPGQSDAQVTAVSFKHTDSTGNNIVQRLVTTAVALVINRGRVILHIDPVSHDHGCSHDLLQQAAIRILAIIVIVQKTATLQVDTARPATRRDYE